MDSDAHTVSLVGHSQLPWNLTIPEWDVRVFRAPGGKAESFFNDFRMSSVLEWTHDTCLLWLGSNDITEDTVVKELYEDISEVVYAIEDNCEADVIITLVEPRFYPDETPVSHETYAKIQKGVNRRLKRSLSDREFINFNSSYWVNYLDSDGVHFDYEGKRKVKKKLIRNLKWQWEGSDGDTEQITARSHHKWKTNAFGTFGEIQRWERAGLSRGG